MDAARGDAEGEDVPKEEPRRPIAIILRSAENILPPQEVDTLLRGSTKDVFGIRRAAGPQ